MRTLLLTTVLLLLPVAASAQTYETIRNTYPEAIETTVTSEDAFVYEDPDLKATIVGKYSRGRELLAYVRAGDFYAVATPARGHVGYVLLTELGVPQVAGAATTPTEVGDYKDPGTARLMSLMVPGGGHIYVGDTTLGMGLMLGSVGSAVGGYYWSDRTTKYVCENPTEDFVACGFETNHDALIAGAALAVGLWGVGILTSASAARRHNRRLDAQAAVVPTADGRMLLAVRLRW